MSLPTPNTDPLQQKNRQLYPYYSIPTPTTPTYLSLPLKMPGISLQHRSRTNSAMAPQPKKYVNIKLWPPCVCILARLPGPDNSLFGTNVAQEPYTMTMWTIRTAPKMAIGVSVSPSPMCAKALNVQYADADHDSTRSRMEVKEMMTRRRVEMEEHHDSRRTTGSSDAGLPSASSWESSSM